MEVMIILFRFLLILHFRLCTSKGTITINQTFKDGDLLISKENKFALGFFSPGGSGSTRRYLGIWFHKIPGQAVVWVANRNNPINGSSGALSINQQGNLVLYSDDQLVWQTNVSGTGHECQLLDSGNLVLFQGGNKGMLWQSFDYPTNTHLPGMKLGLNKKTGEPWSLTSWRSVNDPGTGNYSFRVDPSDSPQFFLYNGVKRYWRTPPWPWIRDQKVFDWKFVNNEDEIFTSFSFHNASFITRIILDNYGVVKWLTWVEDDGQWKEFLSVPNEKCDFHGNCGAYGLCDPNKFGIHGCTCFPGYEPASPKDWYLRDGRSGCVRKQRETTSSVCRHGEGFIKVDGVKLPDTRGAVWVDKSMSRMDCEQECKRNCSCSAYSSMIIPGNTTGCLVWYGELIDTRTYGPDFAHDLYVRVDAIELASYGIEPNSFLESKGTLLIMIISVVLGWMIIVLFIYFWLRKKKRQRMTKNKKQNSMLFNSINDLNNYEDPLAVEGRSRSHQDLVFFDLRTILAATGNFSPSSKIGKGGFGTVYKGQLSSGRDIAIKRMSNTSKQGFEELRNEIMLIAKLQHKNLVRLLGCCIENKEQMLVYEYLPNKSLDTFLSDEGKRVLLDWKTRFNIIDGIARGILYLHQDSRLMIIHRDLKSSNILLDAMLNPKLSDFGMAKLFESDQVQDRTTRIVGTYGYMSPEYAMLGKFSVKSDVFAFGVILLEITSGKRSSSFNRIDSSLSLIGYVWEKWKEGRVLEIVDPSLVNTYDSHEVLRCIQVGLLCVQECAMDRPTMLDVILMLKSETILPSPKQPAFIFGASSGNFKSSKAEERSCNSINDVTITDLVSR